MFSGVAATTCDRPGNSCHVNDHKQTDGEVHRRVRQQYSMLCNITVKNYVTNVPQGR